MSQKICFYCKESHEKFFFLTDNEKILNSHINIRCPHLFNKILGEITEYHDSDFPCLLKYTDAEKNSLFKEINEKIKNKDKKNKFKKEIEKRVLKIKEMVNDLDLKIDNCTFCEGNHSSNIFRWKNMEHDIININCKKLLSEKIAENEMYNESILDGKKKMSISYNKKIKEIIKKKIDSEYVRKVLLKKIKDNLKIFLDLKPREIFCNYCDKNDHSKYILDGNDNIEGVYYIFNIYCRGYFFEKVEEFIINSSLEELKELISSYDIFEKYIQNKYTYNKVKAINNLNILKTKMEDSVNEQEKLNVLLNVSKKIDITKLFKIKEEKHAEKRVEKIPYKTKYIPITNIPVIKNKSKKKKFRIKNCDPYFKNKILREGINKDGENIITIAKIILNDKHIEKSGGIKENYYNINIIPWDIVLKSKDETIEEFDKRKKYFKYIISNSIGYVRHKLNKIKLIIDPDDGKEIDKYYHNPIDSIDEIEYKYCWAIISTDINFLNQSVSKGDICEFEITCILNVEEIKELYKKNILNNYYQWKKYNKKYSNLFYSDLSYEFVDPEEKPPKDKVEFISMEKEIIDSVKNIYETNNKMTKRVEKQMPLYKILGNIKKTRNIEEFDYVSSDDSDTGTDTDLISDEESFEEYYSKFGLDVEKYKNYFKKIIFKKFVAPIPSQLQNQEYDDLYDFL